MWYLIIPPIIVVASFLFVLWQLSRKGADPLIAGAILQSEEAAGRRVAFSRTKSFFLRLLEKIAAHFKVVSLRSHNALHDLTQSLKASQRRFQPPVSAGEPSDVREASLRSQGVGRDRGFSRFFGKEKEGDIAETAASAETELDAPIIRSRKMTPLTEETAGAVPTSLADEPPAPSRPMVSEMATHPEMARKRISGNRVREEDFIARIAANPKDFTAYEGLGDYYLEMNNVKDAKECYRQVLKLSPVQRMVKIKIRRLEKILAQKTAAETK